jgi:hypothetical protein
LTRTVLNAWCDRFPSGGIGRRLVPLFLQSDLREAVACPKTLVLRELAVADRRYCFFATAGRLAETRVVGREDAVRWSEGLLAADGEGRLQDLPPAGKMCGEFVILAASDSRCFARDSREIHSCFMSSFCSSFSP